MQKILNSDSSVRSAVKEYTSVIEHLYAENQRDKIKLVHF